MEKGNESIYAEEHQISLKTNKGAQHMNMWIKSNGQFESDDALDSFLAEVQAILISYNSSDRFTYQDIPKFIIYALHTQIISKFCAKPRVPFVVYGKKESRIDPKKKKDAERYSKEKKNKVKLKFKKVIKWRVK